MDDGEYLSIGKTLDELDGFKLRYEEWNQHFGILKREIRYYKVYILFIGRLTKLNFHSSYISIRFSLEALDECFSNACAEISY